LKTTVVNFAPFAAWRAVCSTKKRDSSGASNFNGGNESGSSSSDSEDSDASEQITPEQKAENARRIMAEVRAASERNLTNSFQSSLSEMQEQKDAMRLVYKGSRDGAFYKLVLVETFRGLLDLPFVPILLLVPFFWL